MNDRLGPQIGGCGAAVAAVRGEQGQRLVEGPCPAPRADDDRQASPRPEAIVVSDGQVALDEAAEVRLGVGGATVQSTQISSDQLDVTTYPSDDAVAVGNRFSLVFDVAPRPGMHVYAPGAEGYRVIRLDLTPQQFIRALPMAYPASEIYFFEPLKERVPVFQKPFRLIQELVVEATPDAQAAWKGKEALTVSGVLEYQACDDKICYNPVTVPLSWSLKLRPGVPGAQQQPGGRGAAPGGAPPPAGATPPGAAGGGR